MSAPINTERAPDGARLRACSRTVAACLYAAASAFNVVKLEPEKMMQRTNDFFNDGFGWKCRHCHRELGEEQETGHSRFFLEGEAESKQPNLANSALARWADAARTTLTCPRCGITELIVEA